MGKLPPGEIIVLLWMCWVMVCGEGFRKSKGGPVLLPDMSHLVISCARVH